MITVRQLIEALNKVENKDIPVYVGEEKYQKNIKKNNDGKPILKIKNKYEIINGGLALTAFILAFDKDRKI